MLYKFLCLVNLIKKLIQLTILPPVTQRMRGVRRQALSVGQSVVVTTNTKLVR